MKNQLNINKELLRSPTCEMLTALNRMVIIQAYVAEIKPTLEALQSKILSENKWRTSAEYVNEGLEDDHVIVDVLEVAFMCAKDQESYYRQYRAGYLEMGYSPVDVELDNCPLEVEKSNLLYAKKLFINAIEPATGIKFENLWCAPKLLEKYILTQSAYFSQFLKSEA